MEELTALTLAASAGAFIWNQFSGILSNFGHTLAADKVQHYKQWLQQGQLPANHHLIRASQDAWRRAVHIVVAQIARENALTTTWWTSFRQYAASRFSLKTWSRNAKLDLVHPQAEWLAELISQLNNPAFQIWHQENLGNVCDLETMLLADPASSHASRTAASFLEWITQELALGDFNMPAQLEEILHGKSGGASLWVLHGLELREILKAGEPEFRAYMIQTSRRLLIEMKREETFSPTEIDVLASHLSSAFEHANLLTPIQIQLTSIETWLQASGAQILERTSLLPEMDQKLDALLRSPGFDLSYYATRVQVEYGRVPVADIDDDTAEHTLGLKDVFVEPDVRSIRLEEIHLQEMPHEAKDLDPDATNSSTAWKERVDKLRELHASQPAQPVSAVLQLPQARGHIIIGDPGAGKTALLRYLTIRWAEQFLSGAADAGPLPVYVELKQYVTAYGRNRSLDLLDYVHEGTCGLATGLDRAQLQKALKQNAALLVLDGLDEIIDLTIRDEVSRHIRDLFDQGYHILLTSRVYGFQSGEWMNRGWNGWMLQPFDEPKRNRFMTQCHTLFFPNETERSVRLTRLQRKLKDFHHMGELASNPLLLTLLCLINRRSGALPDDRTELYEDAASLMIHRWEAFHFGEQGAALGFNLQPLTERQKHDILRRIAWRVMREAGGIATNLFTGALLTDVIQDYIKDRPNLGDPERYAEVLIEQLRQRSFVLCFAGGDYYSFVHRTFLEFYCAWAWQEHPEAEKLNEPQLYKQLIHSHWKEEKWPIIISLTFARLKSEWADRYLRQIEKLTSRGKPCEGLFLAAECLAETKDRALHQEIAEILIRRLLAIVASRYPVKGTSIDQDERNRILRERAVLAIDLLRPQDVALVKCLLAVAKDDHIPSYVRGNALSTLYQIGADLPTVQAAMLEFARDGSTDASVRIRAWGTLGQFGAGPGTVQADLLEFARDGTTDADDRIHAWATLGQIAADPTMVQAQLLEIVQDGSLDTYLRFQALGAIDQIGAAPVTIQAGVLEIARNTSTHPSIRHQALSTLRQTGANPATVQAGLLELARDGSTDAFVRRQALATLGQIGADPATLQAGLLELAGDGSTNAYVRVKALATLAQIGADPASIQAGLLEFARDGAEDAAVRHQALATLGQIGAASATLQAGLLQLAGDGSTNAYIRLQAWATLGQIGAAPSTIQVGLLKIARDTAADAAVRQEAWGTLGQIGAAPATVHTGLLEIAWNGSLDADVRRQAWSTLGQIGAAPSTVEAGLLEIARSGSTDASVRQEAWRTLGQIGLAPATVQVGLLEIARDGSVSDDVRQDALGTLSQIGAAPVTVQVGLLEIARDGSASAVLRGAALGTLCFLCPEDGAIQDQLRKFHTDPKNI